MKKYFLLQLVVIFCVIFFQNNLAQTNYYIPLNFQKAFENRTRSMDGSPGENYWQNHSDYKIKAEIDPSTKLLTGSESIKYYNESPDSLNLLVVRLYQNLNKPESPKTFTMDPRSITEGMEIEKLLVNGKQFEIGRDQNARISATNMIIQLDEPLAPGASINLNFDWNFTIPEGWNPRMGVYDSTSFFIAYWYPQMSVYDDIDGWDTNDYTGQHEFYNDFSNYDVSIKVPNTFGVWATGILQNSREVLNEDYNKKYESAHTSDEIINIITEEDLDKEVYNNNKDWNTWHYIAENVTDFAFGTSDHYLWDATSLKIEDGRRVYIAAVYKKESKDFYDVAEIAKKSIKYFSSEMPAVPFPFPSLTVFNGSGGMEFPMIVNDGSTNSLRGTVGVTSHEIAHSYFPFYMGVNERKYAWMDEGWATALPYDFQDKMVPDYDPRIRNSQSYESVAGKDFEVPLMIPNNLVTGVSYRTVAYRRPGAAYYFLRDALGDDLFLKAMHTYINRWHGKHPVPYDFFNSFNNSTGMNLNWFWKPWFFELGYPDLSINDVRVNGDEIEIDVKKIGNIPVPISLTIEGSENNSIEIYRTAMEWKNGNDIVTIKDDISFDPFIVKLGDLKIPDVDRSNNEFKIK